MASKRKITETVPAELFESIHNLLVAQGYEKSASSLLKEASIDKKKASNNSENLSEIFEFYKSKNPTKKAKAEVTKADSSDSDSSDSSSEDEAPKKPVVAAKPAAKAAPAKKQVSSDSDSSSSSEDEAPAPKKPVVAAKAAAKKDSSSDSDSSSSSSEDEAPPKKVAAKVAAAPAKVVKKAESSSSSSSSSDSSSDEEEAPPKKVAKKVETPAATPAKAPSTPAPVSEGDGKEHKIYVKGLPWLASEAEVRDFFKGCGKILSTECPMGEDGRSSGTAFVKFALRSELEAAVALDGQLWPGTERWLKIQEGVDKPERRSFGGEVGVKPEGCDTVFVGNLPWDVEEEQMREIFGAAGEVSSVRFATGEDGGFRGFGHVSFYNGDDVEAAVKLAGTQLNGRAIRVDYAPPRNRESFGGAASGRGGRGDAGRGRGGGRGGRDGGRGGRGGTPTGVVSKAKGSIAVSAGKKMTFDE